VAATLVFIFDIGGSDLRERERERERENDILAVRVKREGETMR
jgi:hypothetical protein